MQFLVEVIDDHVKNIESMDDTVFASRLATLIVKELQAYNSNVYRASVRVRELAPKEIITAK